MKTEEQYLIQGRDIVVISIQPWYYELGSNCKNIATQFSRHNRVLYINIPITRKTFYARNNSKGVAEHCRIIREKGRTIEQIGENMWQFYPTTLIESINWMPSTAAFRAVNYINNRRFAADIRKAIKEMNFKNIILFNDNDIYNGFHLKELIKPSVYVYYMRDFLQGYPFWKKHSSVLEPKLIAKSDVVVTNSTYYAEYAAGFNPLSYYAGQGCNLALFKNQDYAAPPELEEIKKPLIGYVGALDSARLHIPTIALIARARPDWSVVLVGPEDNNFINSELHQLPNVHFLGRKHISELPAFVKHFDVCMNPQEVNLITTGNYPLKIDEYLALGKPVVATRTKAMKLFEAYTFQADRPEEYPALIEKALQSTTPEVARSRVDFASSHTWENSIYETYRAIDQYKPG